MSGLPRSGSTLLAAILRQNPRLHANVASPVAGLFLAMLREMSAGESAIFFDDSQREAESFATAHTNKRISDAVHRRGGTSGLEFVRRSPQPASGL